MALCLTALSLSYLTTVVVTYLMANPNQLYCAELYLLYRWLSVLLPLMATHRNLSSKLRFFLKPRCDVISLIVCSTTNENGKCQNMIKGNNPDKVAPPPPQNQPSGKLTWFTISYSSAPSQEVLQGLSHSTCNSDLPSGFTFSVRSLGNCPLYIMR